MKKSKKLIITVAGSLVTAVCLLAVTVLCIFAHIPESRSVNSSELSPTIINIGGVPISQQRLSEKYGVYTHENYENGKKTVTVFSDEQIKELKDRRNRGEWLCLNAEEAMYLINDTVSLFESFDTVIINTLDGSTKIYQTTVDQDEKATNIYNVMLFRLEAFHSGLSKKPISGLTNEMVLFMGMKNMKNPLIIEFEADNFYSYYYEKLNFNYTPICDGGVLMFYKGKVYFVNDISQRVRNQMLCIYGG